MKLGLAWGSNGRICVKCSKRRCSGRKRGAARGTACEAAREQAARWIGLLVTDGWCTVEVSCGSRWRSEARGYMGSDRGQQSPQRSVSAFVRCVYLSGRHEERSERGWTESERRERGAAQRSEPSVALVSRAARLRVQ